ncbi:MAG: hypothetical protein KMY54_08460, partial [Erysipelothrix sp.]|nr:hypothetical protein [Erysipelothrix sp.]
MARRKKSAERIRNEALIVIYAMILIMLVIIAWNQLGIVGQVINGLVIVFFGKFPFIVYILVVLVSIYLIFKRKLPWFSLKTLIGMMLGLLTVLLYLAIPEDLTITGFVVFTDFLKLLSEVFNMEVSANGGLIGAFMFGL